MGHVKTEHKNRRGHRSAVGQQQQFDKTHWQFRYSHGGVLRKKRKGRQARPLTTKTPVHLVLKVDRAKIAKGFRSPLGFKICQTVIRTYAGRFYVKIEQLAICNDHIHLLVRFSKRSLAQNFFRVVAGQIAQGFKNNGFWVTGTQRIWKFRPFTRVIVGWKPYLIVRDYVRLNAKEAAGEIKYSKQRLRGLSSADWSLLWA